MLDLKIQIKKHYLTFLLLFIYNSSFVHSQDFYLDGDDNARSVYKVIDPNWASTSESEARGFLALSGFYDISVESNAGVLIYTGKYEDGKKYTLYRSLLFKDKECFAYTDEMVMVRECAECMTSKLPNNEYSNILKTDAANFDKRQKQLFIDEVKKSFKKDNINEDLNIFSFEDNFDVTKKIETNNSIIIRTASLEQLKNFNAFKMSVSKSVYSSIRGVMVSGKSLDNINTFDLPEMVRIFLEDCKDHGIEVKQSNILTEFKELEDNILGLSYGMNNDKLIKVFVDPVKWSNASKPKKWYLIYHELGHDVLNLSHGNGGKMMFNFIDRSYSWEEFFEDKETMFKFYKKYYR